MKAIQHGVSIQTDGLYGDNAVYNAVTIIGRHNYLSSKHTACTVSEPIDYPQSYDSFVMAAPLCTPFENTMYMSRLSTFRSLTGHLRFHRPRSCLV